MTIDHSDEIGWPAEPSAVSKELNQFQKGALATKRLRRERERQSHRPKHPYCAQCVCDWCSLRRKVAAE